MDNNINKCDGNKSKLGVFAGLQVERTLSGNQLMFMLMWMKELRNSPH